MRIIDNKGRLFGVINIIDLLVIVMIAMAGLSILTNLPIKMDNQRIIEDLYIKVLCRIPDAVVDNKKFLKPGDLVMGGNASIDKILNIKSTSDRDSNDIGYSCVTVLIKARCVVLNGEYYCANMPIKINANIVFSNPTYIVGSTTIGVSSATIIDFYKVPVKDILPKGGV